VARTGKYAVLVTACFGALGGVQGIDKEAFMNCDSLKRITIPEEVEEIRESAFQRSSKLEKVIIPESVKKIGHNAFKCSKMVP
jgi:hypothetical protein